MLDHYIRGWYGLLEVGLLTAIPLWIELFRTKAAARQWIFSPALVVIILFGAGIVVAILQESVKGGDVINAAIVLICFPLAGHVGGRYLTRFSIRRDQHKRGTQVEDGLRERRETERLKKERVGVLTLAGVAVPQEDEAKHFKMIGTTGTGKSTAIRELMTGALSRGDRAIFADPDGGYQEKFYDAYRGDVILNPFSPKSMKWDPFAEIINPYDVEQLAGALIPTGDEGPAREWRGYARTFVTAVIRRCHQSGAHDLAELWRLLTIASSDELRTIVAGTPAQPFLEPSNAKMFSNIRSVTGSALGALEHVQAQRAAAFSVREWVRNGRGVLFIPYQADQIAALRGIIAAWMRTAIFETMSRPAGDQRLWFVVDELDALGNIDGLKDALARLRKFGGRCGGMTVKLEADWRIELFVTYRPSAVAINRGDRTTANRKAV